MNNELWFVAALYKSGGMYHNVFPDEEDADRWLAGHLDVSGIHQHAIKTCKVRGELISLKDEAKG